MTWENWVINSIHSLNREWYNRYLQKSAFTQRVTFTPSSLYTKVAFPQRVVFTPSSSLYTKVAFTQRVALLKVVAFTQT